MLGWGRTLRSSQMPPGPRGYPPVGVFLKVRQNPLQFFVEMARRYGDVVSVPLGVRRLYLVSHPDHIQRVLQDSDGVYQKGPAAARVRSLFDGSLTMIDGEPWRRRRQLMRPAFQPPRLLPMVPMITELTGIMLDRWQHRTALNQPLDLLREMTDLTRAIILRVVFGYVAPSEAHAVGQALGGAVEHVNQQLWSALGWLGRFPTPAAHRGRRALRTLDELISRRIEQGHRQGHPDGDLLTMLREARDEETGQGLTEAQLHSEVKALLVAGHTTTSSGLAWVWYLLSQHPAVEQRLGCEVQAILEERPPAAEDLSGLEHTRKLIEETLRLYPPTWVTARRSLASVDIGGFHIPANATVLVSPYVMHRDPRFWEEPERFDPDRFSLGRSVGRPRGVYFPFGAGPRACIGSAFALVEMQLIVAMVAQRYRLTLIPGRQIEGDPVITLRPRHGLLMTLHRRPRISSA
jgi:cytochrome P450